MKNSINPETDLLLKQFLSYDAETGLFTWLKKPSQRCKIGTVAGHYCKGHYITIDLRGKRFYAHRLAWWFHTGSLPKLLLDHKDGDKWNNRFENLRECSYSENGFNQMISKRNTSGVKGVHWSNDKKRWIARLVVGGSIKTLGCFKNKEDAVALIKNQRAAYHGDFSRI